MMIEPNPDTELPPGLNRRAVSELVGFAVIFGIVVTSVALIYTIGIGALTDLQHGEAMDNADRAFDIVAANMEDIHRNGAPARSTELRFAGGEVAITGRVSIELVVQGSSPPNASTVTPISYRHRDTAFHYVSGAVIRTDRNNSIIVRDPPFRFGENRTVIPLVATTARGDTTALGGTGPIHLAARRHPPGSLSVAQRITNGTNDVTYELHVMSPRYRAWGRYFEDEGLVVAYDAANNTVIATGTTDELYVRRTPVAVRLSS